jgi:hypothetical protein
VAQLRTNEKDGDEWKLGARVVRLSVKGLEFDWRRRMNATTKMRDGELVVGAFR